MRLIDQIEAAETQQHGAKSLYQTIELKASTVLLIKAALEAGGEMAKHLAIDPWKEDDEDVQAMLTRFRAAAGEGS